MRVIAGKARRIQLKTIEGTATRPTTDRIKETLFNMINSELYDSRFLDLFSGSGGIGIEALSRGAAKSYFVENAADAAACIEDNLRRTGLYGDAVVMRMDAVAAVRALNDRQEQPFDFIFMDPPYGKQLEKEVLEALRDTRLADEYTTIIIEADIATDISYIEDMGFCIDKIKEYRTNKHVFVSKR